MEKRQTKISLPELALVAGTRAILGAGIGLLLADRLGDSQRRAGSSADQAAKSSIAAA